MRASLLILVLMVLAFGACATVPPQAPAPAASEAPDAYASATEE